MPQYSNNSNDSARVAGGKIEVSRMERQPVNAKRAPAIMISLEGCPRCNGAMLKYPDPVVDGTLCVNCGWRKADVPPEIQTQVEAHLGKPYMEERYTHSRIGTGKLPLNGWERVKRRREREKAAM